MDGGTRQMDSPYGNGTLSREIEANLEMKLVVELCTHSSRTRLLLQHGKPSGQLSLSDPGGNPPFGQIPSDTGEV